MRFMKIDGPAGLCFFNVDFITTIKKAELEGNSQITLISGEQIIFQMPPQALADKIIESLEAGKNSGAMITHATTGTIQ